MSVPPALIDAASIALVESDRAAKVLAMADGTRRSTLVHAYACRVDRGRCEVTVTVDRGQAGPLLAALATNRRVALVVCHIQTFQSLQLKGDDARLVPATDADRAAAVVHGEEFARFGGTLGHSEEMMRAHMRCRAEDIVAIAFTVRQAFVQTPGPAAGQPLAVPS